MWSSAAGSPVSLPPTCSQRPVTLRSAICTHMGCAVAWNTARADVGLPVSWVALQADRRCDLRAGRGAAARSGMTGAEGRVGGSSAGAPSAGVGCRRRRERLASTADVRIGTAGWSIPRAAAGRFDSPGTHLQRYSRRLDCAEINSSFHRPHAAATYAKWRDSTPPGFRFAVKIPRAITHELRLRDVQEPFVTFLAQTDGLADKRGPLLLQLPPSLSFDASVVTAFLDLVRRVYDGPIACEPRHASWFSPRVTRCWSVTESHELEPTRRRCRTQPLPPAGRASCTSGCTAPRGCTGHAMTRTPSRRSLRASAGFRPRSRCGACLTTPQAAPPSRTRANCVNA